MTNNNRIYAATVVIDTSGSEGSADAMISKISEIIAGLGGEVKKVENLGLRDLVRPQDRNLSRAAYIKIDFESGPEGPARVKEKLRLDKNIDRILIERS